jgi:hypothetical protein
MVALNGFSRICCSVEPEAKCYPLTDLSRWKTSNFPDPVREVRGNAVRDSVYFDGVSLLRTRRIISALVFSESDDHRSMTV